MFTTWVTSNERGHLIMLFTAVKSIFSLLLALKTMLKGFKFHDSMPPKISVQHVPLNLNA